MTMGSFARVVCGLLIMAFVAPGPAAGATTDALTRARLLYNQRQWDAAIAAAKDAARQPATLQPARLLLARACLERFRRAQDAADLSAARESLALIDADRLQSTDRTELLVGWGELFFLDGQPGIAAELFDAALAKPDTRSPVSRDRMLDWWAQSLDRLALGESTTERHRVYDRILARVDRELERLPESSTAIYWAAAAARGAGDLDRAWSATRAGWIRARIIPGGGTALRNDLDRLTLDGIIPDRARLLAGSGDPKKPLADMRAEWDALKKLW